MNESHRLARITDPLSSQEAASEVVKSGKVGNHSRIVLKALALHPGSTYKQLASHIIGLDRHEVARRLPGLRNKGKVAHCEYFSLRGCFENCKLVSGKLCSLAQYHKPKSGTRMLKWWVV